MFKTRLLTLYFLTACSLLNISIVSCKSKLTADLIIHHARIYTVDSVFSVVEAMVIKDKKIVATGTNEEILRKYESSEIMDASGKVIFPGFIDAHCHFTGFCNRYVEVRPDRHKFFCGDH